MCYRHSRAASHLPPSLSLKHMALGLPRGWRTRGNWHIESISMNELVLITGGAGFIGSHVADELLQQGYRVRALDNLSPQVHGAAAGRPEYLNEEVELIEGDVRDPAAIRKALAGVDAVIHLAAAVG